MKKEKINKYNKSRLVIGSLIILIGFYLFLFDDYSEYKINKIEEQKVEKFFDEQNKEYVEETILKEKSKKEVKKTNNDYVAIIEILTINLKKGLVSKSSDYNNVNYNIEILNESKMPDVENGNFILAGHSGTGRVAFFKRLHELKLGNEIYIYFKGIKYRYKVAKIYDIPKNGYALINRDKSRTTLTMITCKDNTDKQIVVISYLID